MPIPGRYGATIPATIGSGLAIVIDVVLVRGVLVLDRHARYAPRSLRKLHARVGLEEAPAQEERTHAGV